MAAAAAFESGREVAEDVADAGVGEEQIGSKLRPDFSRWLLLGLLWSERRPGRGPGARIEVGTLVAIVVCFGGTVARPVPGTATLVAAGWGCAAAHSSSVLGDNGGGIMYCMII